MRADGRVLVLGSAVCFATTGTAQALGVDGASPVTVGAARIAAGALFLAVAAGFLARSAPARSPVGTTAGGRVLLGAVGVAAYQPCFFLGVHRAGVAVGTVVALGSAPAFTGVLAHLTGRGRPGAAWVGATALAGAGLGVLVLGDLGRGGQQHAAGVDPGGVLLALGAGAAYAVYTLSTKDLLDAGMSAPTCMAAVFSGGAVLLAPAFLLLPAGWVLTGRGALEVLFLGLVPTALAYLLFARGLSLISAAETASLTLAEPLTATALGLVVLGERIGPVAALGGVLLLAALAFLTVRPRDPVPA